MNFPPHIESKFAALAKKKNYSEVESLCARQLIIKLAQIRAEIIRDKIREQFKQAA